MYFKEVYNNILNRKSKFFPITFYLIYSLICWLVFLAFFSVLLIYHGPFVKLKDYIVSTSMHTNRDRFFATWFLNKNEIDNILSKTNPVVIDGEENLSNIKVQNNIGYQTTNNQISGNSKVNNVTGINIIDIVGKNYKGKLIIISNPSKVTLGLAPKLAQFVGDFPKATFGLTPKPGQIGAPLSEIVKFYKATGGINAGGFIDDNFLGTGGKPEGIVIENGKIKFIQTVLKTFNIIGFNKYNILVIGNSMTLDQINKSDLRCAVSFGPALILNGKPLVIKGGETLTSRSAIAQRKDGTILLLAIDGRQTDWPGANYMDIQNVLLNYDAYNAANLDGGSSTTLNYQGKTVNRPCDITGERSIASAFLIMP